MTGRQRRYVTGAIAVIAMLASVVAVLVARRRVAERAVQVQTAQVTSGTIARRVLATGTLEPQRAVNVGSRVSGTIASIDADFNSPVRAGQVLARLDPATYQAALAEAQARVLQARGEVKRVSAVYDNARTAMARAEARAGDDPLMSRAELDAARVAVGQAAADVKRAEADLAAAEAAVAEARIDLDHTVIRSPIDGVVISRYVDVGQTITARIQAPVLFTVADLRRMQLLAEVGEADVGGLRAGSDVSFQVESIGGRTFEGTISSVRLEPVVEQPATSTSGSSATSPAAVGTSGTAPPSGSATGSRPAGGDASAPGTGAATQSGSAQPGGASGSSSSAGTPSSGSAPSTSQSSSRTPRVGVVTYTAVIDVDNVDRTVPPGGTAIVTLDGPRRDNVVRIPNSALSFQPPAAVFEAVGQAPPALAGFESAQVSARGTRDRDVWKYEGGRFVPVHVRLGLADDTWTEVVSGPINPGDALVTSAVSRKAGIH